MESELHKIPQLNRYLVQKKLNAKSHFILIYFVLFRMRICTSTTVNACQVEPQIEYIAYKTIHNTMNSMTRKSKRILCATVCSTKLCFMSSRDIHVTKELKITFFVYVVNVLHDVQLKLYKTQSSKKFSRY